MRSADTLRSIRNHLSCAMEDLRNDAPTDAKRAILLAMDLCDCPSIESVTCPKCRTTFSDRDTER